MSSIAQSRMSPLTPMAQSLNDLLVVAEYVRGKDLPQDLSRETTEGEKSHEEVLVTIFSKVQDQGLFLQEAAKGSHLRRIFEEKTPTDSIRQSYQKLQALYEAVTEKSSEELEKALHELHTHSLCPNIKSPEEVTRRLLMCKYRLNAILAWLGDKEGNQKALEAFRISWMPKEIPPASTPAKVGRVAVSSSSAPQTTLSHPSSSAKKSKKRIKWKENLEKGPTPASPSASPFASSTASSKASKAQKSTLKEGLKATEFALPTWAMAQESILETLKQQMKMPSPKHFLAHSLKDPEQLKVLVYEFAYEILRVQEDDKAACAAIKTLPRTQRVQLLSIFEEKDFCDTLKRLLTIADPEYDLIHHLLQQNAKR